MIQEPGCVFVYWNAGQRQVEGYEASAIDLQHQQTTHAFRTPGDGNRGYLRVNPGHPGRLVLRPLHDGTPAAPLASVSFTTPRGASGQDLPEHWLRVTPLWRPHRRQRERPSRPCARPAPRSRLTRGRPRPTPSLRSSAPRRARIGSAMAAQGYLSLVLHAHLPYVRHPELQSSLEERWLFEAITETYVPLLRAMQRLHEDGIPFRITMTLTPTLCEMLANEGLNERYAARLKSLTELAQKEAGRRKGTEFEGVAAFYATELDEARRFYEGVWGRRLLSAFRLFQERGYLEIVTCAATHGILPLTGTDEGRNAQIAVACDTYERHFGRRPAGIWLPECAYMPGLDQVLARHGLRYFFGETHALQDATPPPRFGTLRPVFTPSGVAVFGRDVASSNQVWSGQEGYPGDPVYREFYRDLGYDLPDADVAPFLDGTGNRRHIGLKYHRITGEVPSIKKAAYDPHAALERADVHAAHFLQQRARALSGLKDQMGFLPHLTAPYDAELFGHWWFEGPRFIESLMRFAALHQDEVQLITPRGYLDREPVHQMVVPSMSSWGEGGYFKVWLNGRNDWIYPHLHRAEERMVEMARDSPPPSTT